jgi:MATE family multidrug resistance protein
MSALIATEGLFEPEEDASCTARRRAASNRDAPAGSLRELLAVAMPLVLSSGSLSLMNVIDRIFLTHYSTDALAAASPAGMLHWTAMSLVIGMASCVTAFVAQYDGAGRKHRAAASLWQGIYVSLSAGLIFLAVVPLAPAIFEWAGHAPRVQELEVEYFSVLCYGAVPMTLCTALGGFYSGRGRTWTVLAVNALLAATNTLLAWFLVLGPPRMGIRGAALATVTAYVVAVAAYFLLLTRRNERIEYGVWANRKFDGELFGRLVRYGLPSGCQFFADIAAFTLFLFLIGRLGPLQQAATNLAFNLNGLAFVPLLGMGTAVMSLVGRRIGEGRPELAVRTTWKAFALGGGWMLAFGAAYLTFPDLMLAPYAGEASSAAANFAAIRDTTVELLHYVALYAFFDAMVVIFSNAVRGAGDTRFPMVFMLVTSWGVMLGPVWVASYYGKNSLGFSWSMCTVAVVVGGVGMMTRFARGRWKGLSMIESDPVSESNPVLLIPGDQPEPAFEAAAV